LTRHTLAFFVPVQDGNDVLNPETESENSSLALLVIVYFCPGSVSYRSSITRKRKLTLTLFIYIRDSSFRSIFQFLSFFCKAQSDLKDAGLTSLLPVQAKQRHPPEHRLYVLQFVYLIPKTGMNSFIISNQ
jgi:hypothetical protein